MLECIELKNKSKGIRGFIVCHTEWNNVLNIFYVAELGEGKLIVLCSSTSWPLTDNTCARFVSVRWNVPKFCELVRLSLWCQCNYQNQSSFVRTETELDISTRWQKQVSGRPTASDVDHALWRLGWCLFWLCISVFASMSSQYRQCVTQPKLQVRQTP